MLGHLQVKAPLQLTIIIKRKHIHFYLEVLHISGVQRDLVGNGIYWLELYEYKRFFKLNLETGMGKSTRKTKTPKLGGVPGWILGTLGWPIGCPGVEFWRRF